MVYVPLRSASALALPLPLVRPAIVTTSPTAYPCAVAVTDATLDVRVMAEITGVTADAVVTTSSASLRAF